MIFSDLAYIVHSRPYRETSQLITVVGRESGRVALVFKGARRAGRPPAQPFSLLQMSWSGKSELKSLRSVETLECRLLRGRNMYIGLYLNELLVRVLPDTQAVTPVFDRYHHLVQNLALSDVEPEPLLRSFEYALLDQMGYGFALDRDAKSGEKIKPGQRYLFDPLQGIYQFDQCAVDGFTATLYQGEHLLAMAAMDYSDEGVKGAAKQLMREALKPHLGPKPLMSRELFKNTSTNPGA